MRGSFMILIVIVVLIVGILTIKNMRTETEPGVDRAKTVEKAEEAARQAEEATKRIEDAVKNIQIPAMEE